MYIIYLFAGPKLHPLAMASSSSCKALFDSKARPQATAATVRS